MPTIMTHAAVGLGLGRVFTSRRLPPLFWVLCAALPMLPDADVLAFRLGIPYRSPFGHRGFTHSLCFALAVSLVAAAGTFRRFSVRLPDLWGFFFVVAVSHCVLDAMTNGGLGVASFWPWDDRRMFLPWRPIEVSPIGLGVFGERGRSVLLSEFLWVWLPTAALVGAVELYRRIIARRSAR
jgi:inner membrane protein